MAPRKAERWSGRDPCASRNEASCPASSGRPITLWRRNINSGRVESCLPSRPWEFFSPESTPRDGVPPTEVKQSWQIRGSDPRALSIVQETWQVVESLESFWSQGAKSPPFVLGTALRSPGLTAVGAWARPKRIAGYKRPLVRGWGRFYFLRGRPREHFDSTSGCESYRKGRSWREWCSGGRTAHPSVLCHQRRSVTFNSAITPYSESRFLQFSNAHEDETYSHDTSQTSYLL